MLLLVEKGSPGWLFCTIECHIAGGSRHIRCQPGQYTVSSLAHGPCWRAVSRTVR
jgi:hypothetical protein